MKRIPEITIEELQTAINRLKKTKRNQSRRHQSLRRRDERDGEADLQRVSKASWIYTRNMSRSENKSETQKVTLKMSETTADIAEQQIVSQTSPNPRGKSGEFRSSYPKTEHLATYKMIDQKCHEWREKCGLLQSTSWKHSTPSLTNQFVTPSNLSVSNMNTSISWETVQWPESRNIDRRRKWHVRYRERNQANSSIIKLALQHNSAESIVRRHSALAKAEWVSASETTIMIASQICDFCRRCTPICSFKRRASKHVLWLQAQHRKMGLRIHEGKTRILSNQSSNRRKIDIDNINVEMFARKEKQNIWAKWLFSISKRRQKTGIASKLLWQHSTYRQELTSKTYMLRHRLRLFDAMVSPTMNYASGTWTHTKEHERMIQCNATQNASLHHTNEKEIQKDWETERQDQWKRWPRKLG